MPKPFPAEFRRDVVAVARKHEAPISQIAKDFGISEATLHNWLKKADIEDGARPGVTEKEAAELRDARKRIRLLEQENEILRRAAAFFARELPPKGSSRWSLTLPLTEFPSRWPAGCWASPNRRSIHGRPRRSRSATGPTRT